MCINGFQFICGTYLQGRILYDNTPEQRGKYGKISFKNWASPCYFLSSRGLKIKNITKIEHTTLFLLTFQVSFFMAFLMQNQAVHKLKWIWKKCTSNTTMKITSFKIYRIKYDNGKYLLLCGEKQRETFQNCTRIIPLNLI